MDKADRRKRIEELSLHNVILQATFNLIEKEGCGWEDALEIAVIVLAEAVAKQQDALIAAIMRQTPVVLIPPPN